MNKLSKALCGTAAVFGGSMACYLSFVVADELRGFCDECDYLIILGGKVIGADTPGDTLKDRISCAAEYLCVRPNVIAVPTGGCFREGQEVSEADIIARGLIAAGVDESRILPEREATTTYENFINSFKIIAAHSGKPIEDVKIAALSSGYHMHRAAIIAKHCGKENIGRVAAKAPTSVKSYLREYFVAYEMLLKILKIKS